jgi:flagellar biosynthesis protein FlhA
MAVETTRLQQLSWMQNTDILISIGILCVICMMVVPLPPVLVDFFLAGNLMLGFVILLMVMYTVKATEFPIFPTVLLISTVYRLALEVTSSRLILLGRGEEIAIVKAFGSFVIGENFVVGIILFLILLAVQFLVVIRGTTRVSEVAARFTLDAMPGKQMAIDADLNAGLITEREAIERRLEIRREADFYGAMDGAAKFIQGDVIAALIIMVVNIVGGLCIGVIMYKMEIMEAVRSYTMLTIGSGLTTIIPAFLISVSSGLIVTRAVSESNLGMDIARQLFVEPKTLLIGSGAVATLGLFTPLPTIPLVTVAAFGGIIGYIISQAKKTIVALEEEEKRKEEIEAAKKPESVVSLLQVDPMELEIGYSLIPLVDPEQGGDLLERVTMIRRQAALDLGLVIPPIRIRDNMQLKPDTYVIKIRGVEVARGEIKVDQYLAMNPGTVTEEIKGEETIEPAFGLPAIWITDEKRTEAETAGYTVVDPPSIVATHLTEVIRKNASMLLGRQDVQQLLDNVKQNYQALVDELVPNLLSLGEVQKVLHNLLDEGVSIRDLVTVLETLADWAPKTKDIDILTEKVRSSLSRQISKQYQTPEGSLMVITLDPQIEDMIAGSIQVTDEGEVAVLDPTTSRKIFQSLAEQINKTAAYQPIVLCSPKIRRHFKKLTKSVVPHLVVLSYNEVSPDVQVQSIGLVSI